MPSRPTESDYRIEDRGHETPCWIWLHGKTSGGYGQFWDGAVLYAHVASYSNAYGAPEPGRHVHHRCEQRDCVRPDHLEALTSAEHRARHRKFGPELVEEIRRATGSTRQIARRYGISKSHVWSLRSARFHQ